MKTVLWVVEARDVRGAEWEMLDYTARLSRSDARHLQKLYRPHWRYTRVVKYVREGAK